jgi:hypothetical protein
MDAEDCAQRDASRLERAGAASAALRHLTQKRKSCARDAQVSRIRSPTAIDGMRDHESCLARIIAIAVKSRLGTPGAEWQTL